MRSYNSNQIVYTSGIVFRNQDSVNLAIAYYFSMIVIHSNFSSFIPNVLWRIVELTFYLLVLNSLPRIIKSLNIKHIILMICFASLYIISYFFAKDISVHYDVQNVMLRWGFPLFFLGSSIRDIKDLLLKFKIVGYIAIISSIVGLFVLRTNGAVVWNYSQDTGYQTLLPFSVFTADYIKCREKKSLILSAISFLIMLMGGARGPLLAFTICFLLEFFLLTKFDGKRFIIIITVLIVLIVLYILLWSDFLSLLVIIFSKIGISTRIITKLQTGTLGKDLARTQLQKFALDYINNHWLLGTGLVNDRRLIFDNLTVDTNKTVFGYYCHNIFLEVCMQLGLVWGVIANILFIKYVIRSLRKTRSNELRVASIIILSIGFAPLLVSYSYLSYQYFYLYIGFLLSIVSIENWQLKKDILDIPKMSLSNLYN